MSETEMPEARAAPRDAQPGNPSTGLEWTDTHPNLVFTAPYFAQVPLAEILEPAVTEAAIEILPPLVQPAADQAAAEAVAELAVMKVGDTMTGPLFLSDLIPTVDSQAASKHYVDAVVTADISHALLDDLAEIPPPPPTEAPVDGKTYGRTNAAWTQVLPLTGGTVSSHLTGTTTASTLNIVTTAVGSGVNGPATLQGGLNIDLQKDGWYAGTAAVGEIDGLVISCRQGGANSDCGGMLINVQSTGQSFLAISEAIATVVDPATSTLTKGIRVQVGAIDGPTNQQYGEVISAEYGTMGVAHQVQNAPGAAWGYAYRVYKDGVATYTVDQLGDVLTTGNIECALLKSQQFNCVGEAQANILRANATLVYLRPDNEVFMQWNWGTSQIDFRIGATTKTLSIGGGGTLNIFDTQVLQYRITGWGAATGGSKAAFNAGTATLAQTAAALAQLITDLRTHGLIGT